MAKKKYSEDDKENIRRELLDIGMDLFIERGIRNTTLADIIQKVGISKPYFYTFFASYGELIGAIIERQRMIGLQLADRVLADDEIPFEDEVYVFLLDLLDNSKFPILMMDPDDTEYVFNQQNHHVYSNFQKNHAGYYEMLMLRFGIPSGKIDPRLFGNLYMILLRYIYADEKNLLFMFHEERDATLQSITKMLADYLTGIREK